MDFLKRLAKGMLLLAVLASSFAITAHIGGWDANAYSAYTATVFPGDVSVVDLKLRGNDVLDSNGVTRLTVGTTNTLTGINALVGATTVTGNVVITGSLSQGSFSAMSTPAAAQTIAAAGTIAADSCGTLKRITSADPVTTNTTNTFTAPAAGNTGCIMWVVNVGTNTITLDNNANFKSVSAGDVALGAGNIVGVASDGTYWYQTTAQIDD